MCIFISIFVASKEAVPRVALAVTTRKAFKQATCCGQVAPPPATSWLWTGAKVASAQDSSGNHRVDFQDMIKFELTMGNLRSVSHVMPPCSLTKFLFVVYTCCVVLTSMFQTVSTSHVAVGCPRDSWSRPTHDLWSDFRRCCQELQRKLRRRWWSSIFAGCRRSLALESLLAKVY